MDSGPYPNLTTCAVTSRKPVSQYLAHRFLFLVPTETHMAGKRFATDIDVKKAATSCLQTLDISSFYDQLWLMSQQTNSCAFFIIVHFPCNYIYIYIFFFGRNSPQWARASSFTRFLDHTQRNTTVGRTPLDE
jgi:hypothetical protein